ncbi:PLP-dependent transferase [Pseudomonas amygdali]|uniref:PLP-dependent transferase n=1 Tax=Pseudomonas amygdali TaxID=47877 RepID=UPI0016725D40|nr:PLP-dependent transferase [Pseudomonas amygdali]
MSKDISITYLSELYRLMIAELREPRVCRAQNSSLLLALNEHMRSIYDKYWGEQRQATVVDLSDEEMLWAEYEKAAAAYANALNAQATIATCYSSMAEYWQDVRDQECGKSENTIWDIYEHGSRRRLESTFADELNVQSALLLNSGMSAISVAMSAIGLKSSDHVLVGKSSYFETNEVLEHFSGVTGCQVHSIDFLNISAFEDALKDLSPKLLMVEVATNCPTPVLLPDFSQVDFGANVPIMICDQTIVGFPSEAISLKYPGDVIYLASLSKFVTNSISAGLIFGQASNINVCRKIARFSGQNLQERAFNFIRNSDIACVGYRMEIHRRNVRLFANELAQVKSSLSLFRVLGRDYLDDSSHESDINGCLIFLALRSSAGRDNFAPELVERHRAVVNSWRDFSLRRGGSVDIRSGFGWRRTSIRCYEGSQLNQPDAPLYIRISVGLESRNAAMCLAGRLVESIREVSCEII